MHRFILLLTWLRCAGAEPDPYLLFRSEDRGRTWTRSDTGLPGNSRINSLAQSEHVIVAGTDAGIFVSDAAGKHWRRAESTGAKAVRVVALAVEDRAFYAAAERSLLVSTNGGSSWAPNETFPPQTVRCLFFHGGVLYLGTDADGVYRSSDFGRTWQHLVNGLPQNSQVLALTAVGGKVFAGLYANGLYRLDGAEEWIRIGVTDGIKPLALAGVGGTLIAGHNPGGIYTSDDLAEIWDRWKGEKSSTQAISSPFNLAFGEPRVSLDAPVWDLAAGDGIAFAGMADGIFYSNDRGQSWSRATQGLPAVSPGVAFLVRSNLVLAATLTRHRSR